MRKIHEFLRLQEAGLSNMAIAELVRFPTVPSGEYLRWAQAAGQHWLLPEELSENEFLQQIFRQSRCEHNPERPLPNWETAREELKKKAVTLSRCGSNTGTNACKATATPSSANTIEPGLRPNPPRLCEIRRAYTGVLLSQCNEVLPQRATSGFLPAFAVYLGWIGRRLQVIAALGMSLPEVERIIYRHFLSGKMVERRIVRKARLLFALVAEVKR